VQVQRCDGEWVEALLLPPPVRAHDPVALGIAHVQTLPADNGGGGLFGDGGQVSDSTTACRAGAALAIPAGTNAYRGALDGLLREGDDGGSNTLLSRADSGEASAARAWLPLSFLSPLRALA